MKFRKKPVEVEAMQWLGIWEDLKVWVTMEEREKFGAFFGDLTNALSINTLEGRMRCEIDDWIIRGIKGEFYPCKPDIFEMTYEKV